MKEEQFNKAIKNINALDKKATKLVDGFDVIETIKEGTSKIASCCDRASNIQSEMDKMLCDFYHMIGMENLTACQTSRLVKAVKSVLQKRNAVKHIVGGKLSLVGVSSLINMKEDGDYSYKFF